VHGKTFTRAAALFTTKIAAWPTAQARKMEAADN